jgi:excisionase family DNA binding protein
MPEQSSFSQGNTFGYEGKDFLNYTEAADYLGIKRATLYNYINDLEIETVKFKRDRRRYLSIEDVRKIGQVKETPWLAGLDRKEKRSGEERE